MHAVEQSKTDNKFKRQYEAMQKKGTDQTAAKRHVCRALLSTVRAIWIKEEEYRDKHVAETPTLRTPARKQHEARTKPQRESKQLARWLSGAVSRVP